MGWVLQRWKTQSGQLKLEVLALFLACRNSKVPWFVKTLAMGIFGYALSPFDFIPDPVPFIGYLDDVGLLLLGLAFLPRMIPSAVLADCRTQARGFPTRPVRWVTAGLITANWLLTAIAIAYLTHRVVG